MTQFCNTIYSFFHSLLRKFEASGYPGHVRNTKTGAFRPILIQRTLRDAGSVLWMDIGERFTAAGKEAIEPYLERARQSGVLTWAMDDQIPTSSRTHPKMFAKLGVHSDGSDLENYNFQHMVSLRTLLAYNTQQVRDDLMSPWVRCALSEDCLEPLGAQSSGCRFDKKPQYRYSGCHGYEVAALNVILGQMFRFDETRYVGKQRFFVSMSEDQQEEDEDDDFDGGHGEDAEEDDRDSTDKAKDRGSRRSIFL